jgi:hypothetical protein
MVLALVRDLLFATKISSTARALDIPCTIVRDPAQLSAAPITSLLLVDLNLPGAIEAAAAYQQARPELQTIGFVSHVDADTIARARAAGLTRVLARSAFSESLPQLLRPE